MTDPAVLKTIVSAALLVALHFCDKRDIGQTPGRPRRQARDVEYMYVAVRRIHNINFMLIGRDRNAVTRGRRSRPIPRKPINRDFVENLPGPNISYLKAQEASDSHERECFRTVDRKRTNAEGVDI